MEILPSEAFLHTMIFNIRFFFLERADFLSKYILKVSSSSDKNPIWYGI